MAMKLLIGFSILILIIVAFFVYENIKFSNYISGNFESTFNTPVNRKAPVIANGSIEISASVDSVWHKLTQINDWPKWQKNVTEATLFGELEQGADFKWKAGGISFTSQIHTMVPNQKFGWTGKTIGASAIHNWKFDSKENVTIVYVEESLQGVFPNVLKSYFQNNLDRGVKENLAELKIASETE